jgi:hypothetical protein
MLFVFKNKINQIFKMNKLFCLLLLLSLSAFRLPHPIHLCKSDLEYHAPSQTLRLTVAIFIDDLEVALRKRGHDKLFVGTEREKAGSDALILAYLQERFALKINDKAIIYQWVGKETERDMTTLRVYLEVPKTSSIKNISFENKILIEIFSDQKNIMEFKWAGKKTGYWLLDKDKFSGQY